MQSVNKKPAGYNLEKKYFWSPAAHWEKKDKELDFRTFKYTGEATAIFPEFYYKAQNGITPTELIQQFPLVNAVELEVFIQDLVRYRILVPALLVPQEIFEPQAGLFKNEYSVETFLDSKELEKFKKKQLSRMPVVSTGKRVELKLNSEYPDIIGKRRSYRIFDTSQKIKLDAFSQLILVFGQIHEQDKIRYYYASAGGLYPIDIYIYIKDNRVETLQGGLYYFCPVDNCLAMVSSSCVITEDAHFFTNRDIFKNSAFSIFFVYNAEATMPKYGGMGYFYACIDTGIMVATLTGSAELNNIGLCSIGNMNFKKIEKYFKLQENQVLIHTIEGGLKTDQPDQNDFV